MTHKFSTGIYKIYKDEIEGLCTFPDSDCNEKAERSITISPKLKGKRKLDVIIHESLHAEDPNATEEWVDTAATNIAGLLWKFGFREK